MYGSQGEQKMQADPDPDNPAKNVSLMNFQVIFRYPHFNTP